MELRLICGVLGRSRLDFMNLDSLISVESCIFLELFTRRAIFPGQDEITQLDVIFEIMGTPHENNWPGLHELPWWELLKPKAQLPDRLEEKFGS
jgi:hypothetical protein